jgi:nucleotide-binding universal stress UspA family protein
MHMIAAPPATSTRGRVLPQMIKRIVVPLDGTPYAEHAVPSALALARAFNAEVALVRANPPHLAAGCPQVRPLRRRERETLHSASLYLARKEQELRTRGVRASSHLPSGVAAEAIATAAVECGGDLIVIATHAGTGLSRPSQVSVARALLRRTEIPVLLLASTTHNPFDHAGGVGLTLLVPLDGTPPGAAALPYATALAQAFAGQILLLRAVGGPAAHALKRDDPALYALGTEPAREQALSYLETLRSRLFAEEIPVWTGIVEGGLLEGAVRQARVGGEMVALSVHGGAERRAATIEAALDMLRRSGVPLLLVPSQPLVGLVPTADAPAVSKEEPR